MKPNSAQMIEAMNIATGNATHGGRLNRRPDQSASLVSHVILWLRCIQPIHSRIAVTTPAATVNPMISLSAAPPPSLP